jgi:hypothetical protein
MTTQNEGAIDRLLRGVLGVLLILSGAALTTGGLAVQIFGVIMIATGIVGWCPLYAMLHLNTRAVKH